MISDLSGTLAVKTLCNLVIFFCRKLPEEANHPTSRTNQESKFLKLNIEMYDLFFNKTCAIDRVVLVKFTA